MRFYLIVMCLIMVGCNKNEAPTGVSRSDVEGIWASALNNVNLMGRTLSGDSDWQFERSTFEIAFLDPPVGQAERISGDWEFKDGKMVMTLRSSFPIGGDVGVTDTLFVSILSNQMSLQTSAGSSILLVKLSASIQSAVDVIWALMPVYMRSDFGA